MRTALLTLASLALIAGDSHLQAPLKRVRVYPDQAWLTRETVAQFEAPGARRLRIEGLPADLDLDHLRVQAEGIPGLRLGHVAVVPVEGRFEPDAAYLKTAEELKALHPKLVDLKLRQSALETALAALESLKPETRSGSQETVSLDPLAAAEFSRAVQTRHGDLLKQGITLEAEVKILEQRAAALRTALEEQERRARHRSSAVLVELEAPEAGQVRIALETQTSEARWKPAYEVRLSEDRKTLELLCYAAVSQASGEAWNGIGLEISNAQPGRNLRVPPPPSPIQMLYEAPTVVTPGTLQGRVTDRMGKPAPGVQLTAFCESLKVTRTVVTDANGVFRFAFLPAGAYRIKGSKAGHPELVQMASVEAGQTRSLGLFLGEGETASRVVEVVGASASVDVTSTMAASTFSQYVLDGLPRSRFSDMGVASLAPGVADDLHEAQLEAPTRFEDAGELGRAWFLEGRRSLPADARPHRVLLSRTLLEAGARLRAVPRISTEVFSLATVSPAAGFPWFQGTPVTVFRGGERLGQIFLPALEAGEPVAFSFGPVPGLRVQRKRVEAKVVGAKAGKGRQWTLRERVTLISDLDREVEVEVLEPGLRAASDKVKVETLPETTTATRRTLRGDLVWSLKVPAREQVKVEEGWRITGPGTGAVPELPALGLPTSD